jgi:hypothetical protein
MGPETRVGYDFAQALVDDHSRSPTSNCRMTSEPRR